jgi:hypothetical protein
MNNDLEKKFNDFLKQEEREKKQVAEEFRRWFKENVKIKAETTHEDGEEVYSLTLVAPPVPDELAERVEKAGVDVSSILAEELTPEEREAVYCWTLSHVDDVPCFDELPFKAEIITKQSKSVWGLKGAERLLYYTGNVEGYAGCAGSDENVTYGVLFFNNNDYVKADYNEEFGSNYSDVGGREKEGETLACRVLPYLDEIKEKNLLPSVLIESHYYYSDWEGQEREEETTLTLYFINESTARDFVNALEKVKSVSLKDLLENPELVEKYGFAKRVFAERIMRELGFDYNPAKVSLEVVDLNDEKELDKLLSETGRTYEWTGSAGDTFREETAGVLFDFGKVEGDREYHSGSNYAYTEEVKEDGRPLIETLTEIDDFKPEQIKCLYYIDRDYYSWEGQDTTDELEIKIYCPSEKIKELLTEKVREKKKEMAQKKENEVERSNDRGISLGR